MLLCTGVAMFATVAYLPIYFQMVQGLSPTDAGLRTVPMTIALTLMSIVSGKVISCSKSYRAFPIVGSLVTLVSCGLLSLVTPDMAYFRLAGFMTLLGLGLGCLLGPLMLIAQNAVPFDKMAIATAMATFSRTLGSALGVAIYGAILNDRLTALLPPALEPLVNAGRLAARVALANETALLHEFLGAYSNSLSSVFGFAAVPMALSLICSLFVESVPLDAHVTSEPQARQQETAREIHISMVLAGARKGGRKGEVRTKKKTRSKKRRREWPIASLGLTSVKTAA